MRRLRQALKRPYYLRRCTSSKDNEGSTYPTYGDAIEIHAVIRHASGRLDAAQYGERLNAILKMQYEGTEPIKEGDGVCVFVPSTDEPDYIVTLCKGNLTEDAFKVYTLEAV